MGQSIKPDSRNYRVHGDENKQVIKKSLDELGAGRSILLDNQNQIIAGNGVFEGWEGKPIRIIETDGQELIAVKRKDLSPDDRKRQQLAFADNHTSDTSTWDNDLLNEDSDLLNLSDWDFDTQAIEGVGFDEIEAMSDNAFIEAVNDGDKFQMTFVFSKGDKPMFEKFLSENNKEKLRDEIVKIVRDA